MNSYYIVNENGFKISNQEECNLEIYKNPSQSEKRKFLNKYSLPKDVFYFDDMPEISPRIENLENKQLGKVFIFIISNVKKNPEKLSVEDRLEAHTFILTNSKLFWFINNDITDIDRYMFDFDSKTTNSLESVIVETGLLTYKNFAAELDNQKKRIDELYKSAILSTSNKVLIRAADTERDMVMLQHAIKTQEIAFEKLLENNKFITNLNNHDLVYDIEWYSRQVRQLVEVYRDLLDATSSLFTDIMSYNLNQLMRYLSTVSIILATSTFVVGFWGMNIVELPFSHHKYGTLIMFLISALAGFIMYLYLKNKNYFND